MFCLIKQTNLKVWKLFPVKLFMQQNYSLPNPTKRQITSRKDKNPNKSVESVYVSANNMLFKKHRFTSLLNGLKQLLWSYPDAMTCDNADQLFNYNHHLFQYFPTKFITQKTVDNYNSHTIIYFFFPVMIMST